MEETKALNRISESADLIRMLEELLDLNQPEKFAAVSPGFKITLKNVREAILESHDMLARSFLSQARQDRDLKPAATASANRSLAQNLAQGAEMAARPANSTIKRDLRDALEKSLG